MKQVDSLLPVESRYTCIRSMCLRFDYSRRGLKSLTTGVCLSCGDRQKTRGPNRSREPQLICKLDASDVEGELISIITG